MTGALAERSPGAPIAALDADQRVRAIHTLFRAGHDTHAIAERLGLDEADVSNERARTRTGLDWSQHDALLRELCAAGQSAARIAAAIPGATRNAVLGRAVRLGLQIRDRAQVLAAYARIAKDRSLEIDAAELRFRAERRLGEVMAAQRERGALSVGGRPRTQEAEIIPPSVPLDGVIVKDGRGARIPADYSVPEDAINYAPRGKTGSDRDPVSLSQLGVGKKLADRARTYAAMPAATFEAKLATRRSAIEAGRRRVTIDLLDEDKAARRAEREGVLGQKIRALPAKRYGVILGDPEWDYEVWSRETGMDRAAANHYPTSPLAALCARDVGSLAADDCVLALWATVPMLAEAFCVLDAWGFSRFERDPDTGFLTLDKRAGRYVSSGAWVKYKPGAGIGMGHWFRVDHEILLLATRGAPPCPAKGAQARSVFDMPASRVHSEKPELVAELLESYFPTVPKIELNRRGAPRPGWNAWGNEAEIDDAEGLAA